MRITGCVQAAKESAVCALCVFGAGDIFVSCLDLY